VGYRGAILDVDGLQAAKDGNVVALGVARSGDEEMLLGAGAVVTTLDDGNRVALAEDRLEQRFR
jgi:hypothetical protein